MQSIMLIAINHIHDHHLPGVFPLPALPLVGYPEGKLNMSNDVHIYIKVVSW